MKTTIRALVFFVFLIITPLVFSQTKTVYMVSNAHLDSQWNWTVQATINTMVKNTLNDNFSLFRTYPTYKFNFEGAIKYMWAKEYYPDLYDTLRNYIARGRWHITGSSLDATDVNVPSPESFFRNVLLGQTFYKKEFNKKSKDIFLPDCFGFSYTLPTIAHHCGLIGFSSQKLSWGSSVTVPFDVGRWQGVDGSQILASLKPGDYTSTITSDLSNSSTYLTAVNNMGTQTGHYDIYRYYGTGDQGGAPSVGSVAWLQTSINGTGPLKILAATSDSLFERYTPAQWSDFSLYNGELLMATHGTGCYTSHTAMKRWNRKNELLGAATERSAVMAQWLGGLSYPADELNQTWTKLIWHQFHDDLTGTSLPSAYTFSENDEVICQNEFATTLTNASGAVIKAMNTQTTGNAIVVYNPLSIQREDIVEASVSMSAQPAYIRVYDTSGLEVPAQILSFTGGKLKFVFVANVKSLSYQVYDVRESSTPSSFTTNLSISNSIIENAVYRITLNANGDVSSILDKRFSNKELLSSPVRLGMFTDQSSSWPSWEILYNAINVSPQNYVDGTPTISIVENGPVRVSLKITRIKGLSTFEEYIRLTNWGPQDRIDFVNTVDWKTKNTLLKAIFPLTVSNTLATYDLGLGVIQRSNNTSSKYEVPAQQWADITHTDNSYGVSIFNDCKYGWDKPASNTLRLTLIHTPGVSSSFTYQQNQDLYKQQFTYSIYGHNARYYEANTVWEADKLNQPLMAFEAPKHTGSLGKSFSFASVNTPQVAIKALKKAENSDDFVVRVYETKGQSANASIKFCSNIISASELNGIEEVIGSATFAGDSLQISMTSFQPKTFSVKLAPPVNSVTNPVCSPLNLSYDDDAITYDANRSDGDFDGNQISYPAELLPDTIWADGIAFKMGPKNTGANNIIRCNGNHILLNPNPNCRKLYMLCASSLDDQDAIFYVDGIPDTLKIPYFSNFIGQAGGSYSTSYFHTDNTGWIGTHRHNGATNLNEPYSYTYLFKYCINLPPNATELVLPVNNDVALFAVTLANNENDDVAAVSDIMDIPPQDNIVTSTCSQNYTQNKPATASGQCTTGETPAKGVDGDENTKWCHNVAGDKWLQVDMGDSINICRWRVVHGGIESTNYITRDFKLQRYINGNWLTIDSMTGNTVNITDRSFTTCKARTVRLLVTNSGSDNAARIYEFQVFGAPSPPTITGLGSTSGCVGSLLTINGTFLGGATTNSVKIGGTKVTSIISNTGTVMVVKVGNGTTGTVSVTTNPGGTAVSTEVFTVNPLPVIDVNTSCLFVGSNLLRTATPAGGTWTSSNTGVATIDNITGMVTAVASGLSVITYTTALTACSNTITQTVNAVITGTITPLTQTLCNTVQSSPIVVSTGGGGTQTFVNSPLTSAPANTGVIGTATPTYTASYLQLTNNLTSQYGEIYINNPLNINSRVFNASFAINMYPTGGADGASFNFGPDIPTTLSALEAVNIGACEKYATATGLAIQMETYGTNYLSVWYGGSNISGTYPVQLSATMGTFKTITISVNISNQLTVTVNGTTYINNFTLPSAYATVDKSNWMFGIATRSGGVAEGCRLKNLSITAPVIHEYSFDGGINFQTSNSFTPPLGADSTYIIYAKPLGNPCASLVGSASVTSLVCMSCPSLVSPYDASTNIATTSVLQWDSVTGATGYKIYFGTDNPPTNIANGSDVGNVLSYDPMPDLNPNLTYYWRVIPYNSGGSLTGCTVWSFTTQAAKTITLKVFVEGLYIGGGFMHESHDFDQINETFPAKWDTDIADTVTVVLYNDTYTNVVMKYNGAYLHTNGTLTIPGISSSLNGSYYITIFHRNSVPITSATPRPFAGSTITFDFTTPVDQAYGAGFAPQKDLGDGFYGMYTGELDQDENYPIDGFDLSLLEIDIVSGPFGYVKTDLNGDGVVDGFDLIIMEPNIILNPLFWNPLIAKKHLIINQNK